MTEDEIRMKKQRNLIINLSFVIWHTKVAAFHRIVRVQYLPKMVLNEDLLSLYSEIYGYEKELIKYTEVIGRKGTGGAPYLFAHCVASQPYERIYRI